MNGNKPQNVKYKIRFQENIRNAIVEVEIMESSP